MSRPVMNGGAKNEQRTCGAVKKEPIPHSEIMLACLFTDRERPTSKRYWWYLPPSILSLLTAIAVGLPQIVDKRIGGFGCWCTLIFAFVCAYHDEMEGLANLHGKLICLSIICAAFAMVCWCMGY